MRFRGSSPHSSPVSHNTNNYNEFTTAAAATASNSPSATTAPRIVTRPAYSWWPSTSSLFLGSHNSHVNKKDDNLLPPPPPPAPAISPRVLASSPPFLGIRSSRYTNTNNMSALESSNELSPSDQERILVPKFAFREITLGSLVGQGGFSDVREIVSVDLEEVFDTSTEETELRKQFSQMANNNGSDRKKFVLKSLRNDLPEEEHTKGILDLAIEADFLATLQHENIISLRATANSDPHENRFFVILDRLSVTLERKFNYWRKIVGSASGFYVPCYGYCCSKSHVLHGLWKERLEVSYQTALAVQYLHAKGIVYRDLKPENIGFDADTGLVKLFDFGLAKRLRDAERAPDNGHPSFSGLYHLTGNTGSLRYMAPEVAKCLPYDQSVDAYSFGILFWQICSLTTPYAKYSTKMHADRVLQQGHRPKPDSSWPPTWIQLQQACWSSDRTFRPPFSQIVDTLRDQIESMEDGVVPSRASEIRAKKKKKRVVSDGLDTDTRKATPLPDDSEVQKRFDNDII